MRVLSFLFLLLVTGGAWACQVCLPYPKQSLLDRLEKCQSVVLTREDPDRAHHLVAIEMLRGDGLGCELFLNSAHKRMLEVYSGRSLICGKNGDEWSILGVCTPENKKIIQFLSSESSLPMKNGRLRYFSKLLTHQDSLVKSLAYLEVAKAKYSEIRSIEHGLTRDDLLEFIANPRMIEWHPLYIILFAQRAHEGDLIWVQERCESSAELHSTVNLSAWLTCYLELAGEEAMRQVLSWYFSDESRSDEEVQAAFLALSSIGETEHRARVLDAYRQVASKRPELMKRILADLERW